MFTAKPFVCASTGNDNRLKDALKEEPSLAIFSHPTTKTHKQKTHKTRLVIFSEGTLIIKGRYLNKLQRGTET